MRCHVPPAMQKINEDALCLRRGAARAYHIAWGPCGLRGEEPSYLPLRELLLFYAASSRQSIEVCLRKGSEVCARRSILAVEV